MCGIAGFINKKKKDSLKEDIEKMLSVIEHRGPDDSGVYVNENNRVALGHRRLSIIDLSEMGRQPMEYLDRYCITFNGEIYNYQELKRELQQAIHSRQIRIRRSCWQHIVSGTPDV